MEAFPLLLQGFAVLMTWKILLLMAALYSLLALALLFQLRSLLTRDKLSLPATMAELRKDRDALL